MSTNQLPPLPEPHIGLPWRHNAKDGSIHSSAFTWAQMHAYALAALAQQAQEPVAAALGDIVALWDKYAPSEYMMAIHMQAKRALAGRQPVSHDMHGWCAYVGGMVACWITSEPDAHARLGDDKFDAAIAGIIERRLWAMPKRYTTPPAPQPAPVDEQAEFEACAPMAGSLFKRRADDPDKYWDGNVQDDWELWQARAALQSPQPAVPVVSDEQIDALAAGNNYPGTVPGYRRFARAILALRPAVEPMTPEQMRRAAMDEMNKIPALANHHSWKGWPGTWAFATAAVNGITAKAEDAHQHTKEAEEP